MNHWSLFDWNLSVLAEDAEVPVLGHAVIPWADFLLNPRRLRGSDFLMRWSQGEWSEKRLIQAVSATDRFVAFPYGPSGVAPEGEVRAYELYFERLEAAGLGKIKRPDVLIFRKADTERVNALIEGLGGLQELPFTPEDKTEMSEMLSLAVIAVECENSLWKAKQMPGYGLPLRPQKRLNGAPGLSKATVAPTIIIKDEDLPLLNKWQAERKVPIHVWHAFYDLAFGLSLDDANSLIATGAIVQTRQVYQAPNGATAEKGIYKFYTHYAYPLGETVHEPTLEPAFIVDKNGHILPYVKFVGGMFTLGEGALATLDQASITREWQ